MNSFSSQAKFAKRVLRGARSCEEAPCESRRASNDVAEREGFEPSVRLLVHTLSKRAR